MAGQLKQQVATLEVAWVDQNKVMVGVVVRMSIDNVSSEHDVPGY